MLLTKAASCLQTFSVPEGSDLKAYFMKRPLGVTMAGGPSYLLNPEDLCFILMHMPLSAHHFGVQADVLLPPLICILAKQFM